MAEDQAKEIWLRTENRRRVLPIAGLPNRHYEAEPDISDAPKGGGMG